MKKTLIILLTIFSIIAIILVVQVKNYNTEKLRIANQVEKYANIKDKVILGTDVATIINRVEDDNKNNTNQIDVKIKFLESDEIYSMEPIVKQGIEKFIQNYGGKYFKCTSIEYNGKKITNIWIEEFSQTK